LYDKKNDLRYVVEIRKIMNKTSFKFSSFIKCSFYSLLFLFFLLSINSCKKNDLVPSYIHIDHISFEKIESIDKSTSTKITDAWVYVDDNLIGIFELPATIPVLASGSHTISVKAGIKLNGIAMSRGYYPFYTTYNTTLNLEEKKIDTIIPVVSYFPDKIQWKEDFEDAGISIVRYTGSDTSIIKTTVPGDAFEGSFSGIANMVENHPYVLCVSDSTLDIPQNQSAVFLELNYKTDTYFSIGMFAKTTSSTSDKVLAITLNPTSEWKKIYINLTPTVNSINNVEGFKVYFEAYKDSNYTTQNIYIDNVKLLYSK
jgi:hypothetical protein